MLVHIFKKYVATITQHRSQEAGQWAQHMLQQASTCLLGIEWHQENVCHVCGSSESLPLWSMICATACFKLKAYGRFVHKYGMQL